MRISYLSGPGISHRLSAADYHKALRAAGATLVAEPRLAHLVIIHDDIQQLPAYFARFPALADRYVIGCLRWFSDALPQMLHRHVELLDEVWVPSRFNAEAFGRAHDRVELMPRLVERVAPRREVVEQLAGRLRHDASRFYFYTITRPTDPRKNLVALLAAFEQLRRRHPELRLLVKQYGRPEHSIAEIPGVVCVTAKMSDEEIAGLHELCDVYVSPHRAEPWGRAMAQAMAHGNPVVATGYSGNLDFMDSSDGYLVPYTLQATGAPYQEANQDAGASPPRWAEVDREALLAAMEQAFEGHAEDERSWRCTAIAARYGVPALAGRMLVRLEQLADRAAEPARRTVRRGLRTVRPRVALMHSPPRSSKLVLGRERVTGAMARAYTQYASRFRYSLIASRWRMPSLSDELGLPNQHAEVLSRAGLDEHLSARSIDVWHDIQLDMHTGFAIRGFADKPFPITILHHTISYQHLFQTAWLPLLLAQPHRYDALICSSTAARRALEHMLTICAQRFNEVHGTDLSYRGRFETIPLGVDLNRFKPSDKVPARRALGLPDDAFVLLWLGRLSAADKADLLPLIYAFVQLRKRHPDKVMKLVCCGTERKGHGLVDALRDYAAHLGVAGDVRIITDHADDAQRLYAAADVFVSPVDNLQESFGVAVIEAMACGVPQVVSDWDGYRDLVVEGETGFIIPSYWADLGDVIDRASIWQSWADSHFSLSQAVALDLAVLLDRLDTLVRDDDLRERMARASRRRAEQQYGWHTIVAAHEALWTDLCEQAAREPEDARGALRYTLPQFYASFAGYPTRMLGDDARLSLSERGWRVAREQEMVPLHYNEYWPLIHRGLIRRLVVQLQDTGSQQSGVTLAEAIEHAAADEPGYPAAEVRRHMLWLLKHDLVRLES